MKNVVNISVLQASDSKVTEKEWELAKEAFAKDPNAVKVRINTQNGMKRSFIKMDNGTILAFYYNQEATAKGRKNSVQENTAVQSKVIAAIDESENTHYLKRQKLGQYNDIIATEEKVAQAARATTGYVRFTNSKTVEKSYIAYKDLGESYYSHLAKAKKQGYSREYQYDLAIQAAIALGQCHSGALFNDKKPRIHGDNKVENMTIDVNGNTNLIDFAYSRDLNKAEIHNAGGTIHCLPYQFHEETSYNNEIFTLIRLFGFTRENIFIMTRDKYGQLNHHTAIRSDLDYSDNFRYIFKGDLIDNEPGLENLVAAASGKKLDARYKDRSADIIAIELMFLRNHIAYDYQLLDKIEKDSDFKQRLLQTYQTNPDAITKDLIITKYDQDLYNECLISYNERLISYNERLISEAIQEAYIANKDRNELSKAIIQNDSIKDFLIEMYTKDKASCISFIQSVWGDMYGPNNIQYFSIKEALVRKICENRDIFYKTSYSQFANENNCFSKLLKLYSLKPEMISQSLFDDALDNITIGLQNRIEYFNYKEANRSTVHNEIYGKIESLGLYNKHYISNGYNEVDLNAKLRKLERIQSEVVSTLNSIAMKGGKLGIERLANLDQRINLTTYNYYKRGGQSQETVHPTVSP
ncbi:hypothetical protein L3V82_06520 [Thiotrichales bacterium 19S3-7]|nr:hypothetical protein [Thiotrichales bacterium 19S3-7]MCF6801751.1 hypothetical protein [Thiotrichales bacterium 19S3-11]